MKQFLVWGEWPPELATTPRFWTELLTTFRATAPLVTYLNDALGVIQSGRTVWPELLHDRASCPN